MNKILIHLKNMLAGRILRQRSAVNALQSPIEVACPEALEGPSQKAWISVDWKTTIILISIAFLTLGSMPASAMQMSKEMLNAKLIHASRDGNLEAVQDAIRAGADLNATDSFGYSALEWAAYRGHKEIIQCLFQEGADLNSQVNDGWTILMFAAARGHRDVVEYFIHLGADLHIINADDNTALIIAAIGSHQSVCEVLVETMLKCPEDACAAHFCMKNMDDNGKIFMDFIEPVCQRISATQYFGYTKTLEEVNKIENNEIRNALLAKYFPDEMGKN